MSNSNSDKGKSLDFGQGFYFSKIAVHRIDFKVKTVVLPLRRLCKFAFSDKINRTWKRKRRGRRQAICREYKSFATSLLSS